ncbi:uncharacterized protein LOC111065766 [Drosophila obscura]|uniref:uncharacterized protein LOC111065766 n=1 Tax=Drosophila obscura TaxID=7282 RepID=UPI001BB2C70B|nr:uncharacterized protein LOC111065766 [Drosophila obscura]XP_022209859.2 uncharacterized protein LOC111065766 [Drosophila obscura]
MSDTGLSDSDCSDMEPKFEGSVSMSVSQTTIKNGPKDAPETPESSKAETVMPQDSAPADEPKEEPEELTEASFGDPEIGASGMSLIEWPSEEPRESEEDVPYPNMSCSSFSSCVSYQAIRQMILQRDPHTSTMSLDSGCNDMPQMNSSHQLMLQRDCREVGGKDTSQGAGALASLEPLQRKQPSVLVVMEPKPNFTENSCMDISLKGDIDIEEVYHKFVPWFKRPEIDGAFKVFNEVDQDADGYISLTDLKRALEKLSVPQTHWEAKRIMAQVAGPHSNVVHFSHLLLMYASLLKRLQLDKYPTRDAETDRFSQMGTVDVSKVGVNGARRYFEAKISLEGERLKPLSLMCTQPVARPSSISSVTMSRDKFEAKASVFKKFDGESNEKKN